MTERTHPAALTPPGRTTHRKIASWLALAGLSAALALGPGCRRSSLDTVAALDAHLTSSRDPRILEIRAQVALPSADLRFKWFADAGECAPQESTEPATLFRFAHGVSTDRITLEVWRGERRLGRAQLAVSEGASIGAVAVADVQVTITEIPPAAPGGPNTRAQISGRVSGKLPDGYRVLVYARDAGVWFIQPTAHASHAIAADGTWSTWTHTGTSYAALVVSPRYSPIRTLDTLPQVRGEMVARVIVDGVGPKP